MALAGVAACLLATSCGDGDEADTSDPSSSSTTTADSGPPSVDEIYNACLGQLAQTSVSPEAAQMTCAQARELFSECVITASKKTGAEHDDAITACEDEAEDGLAELGESAPSD